MCTDRPSARVRLEKVKRPGGTFWYDLDVVAEDEHGAWLYGATGSPWGAPHDSGGLPYPVVVLIEPSRPAVAWWVADPRDRRLEIDVCLPPERRPRVWRYVDLELDPVLHLPERRVEIEDEDQFADACAAGLMTEDDAALARHTADRYAAGLRAGGAVWIDRGWDLLVAQS